MSEHNLKECDLKKFQKFLKPKKKKCAEEIDENCVAEETKFREFGNFLAKKNPVGLMVS